MTVPGSRNFSDCSISLSVEMETGLLSSQVNVATTLDMPKSKQISNTHLHIYM